MARLPCIDRTRKRQRGDMLLEALIAVLLLAVIGLGMVYVTARAAVAQRTVNAGNLAVSELRSRLQIEGFAADCPAEGSTTTTPTISLVTGANVQSVEKTCTVQASTVRIDGKAKSVKVPHLQFRLKDPALFGSQDSLLLGN